MDPLSQQELGRYCEKWRKDQDINGLSRCIGI